MISLFLVLRKFNILSQAVEIKQKLIPFNHFIHLISRTRIERIQHLLVIKDETNQHQDTWPKHLVWVYRQRHAIMQCNTISAARVRCRPINPGCHKRIHWVLARLCVLVKTFRIYEQWTSCIKAPRLCGKILRLCHWTKVASSDKESYYRFSSNGHGLDFSIVHSTFQCWKSDKVNVYVQRFLKF